jgi:hypothetical protein
MGEVSPDLCKLRAMERLARVPKDLRATYNQLLEACKVTSEKEPGFHQAFRWKSEVQSLLWQVETLLKDFERIRL